MPSQIPTRGSQEDDCFPKHLCRNCYRSLLNLRDKLLASQTRCATTQINLGKGGENVKGTQNSPKSSPFTLPCGAQRQESHLNANFVLTVPPFWKFILRMRTCFPCHIPDRWSRGANWIWPDLAFGFVHKRSGNEIT